MNRQQFVQATGQSTKKEDVFRFAKENHTLKMVVFLESRVEYQDKFYNKIKTWYGFNSYYNIQLRSTRYSSKQELRKLIKCYCDYYKKLEIKMAIIYTADNRELARIKDENGTMYRIQPHRFLADDNGNDIIELI